ncbi:SusC/RagA family TonB-linked outer membrane protein [Compostibacter hankyongensis]|uniref:TonB-dependent receptor n=1 Tax=Compostibacter hankyongensis TaxID=1007089 RepID=A0ABP8FJD8_9BACT
MSFKPCRLLTGYFCLILTILLAQTQQAAAQQALTISGTVTDSATNSPLPGVNIAVEGTPNGVATDPAGKFHIQAAKGAALIFSFTGYQTVRRTVVDTLLNVKLGQQSKSLKAVVVTALGIERETKTLTYALQQIQGSKLTEVRDPNANVVNSLAGKIAGAVVTPSADGPGSATRVVLRGNRTISNSNTALMVIDGVAVDNSFGSQPTDETGGSNGYTGGDGTATINPDDIESVSVLKGAAATALYGSRAGNGAIVITTKKGAAGKVAVNYSGSVTMQPPYLLIPFQNSYGRGNGGTAPESPYSTGASWGPETKTYPDNVRDFFNTANTVNNTVNISGGSEKVQAYTSYTNNYATGNIPGNELNRNTLNLRINTHITDKLTTDAKLTYVSQSIKNKPRLGETGTPLNAFIMPRDLSPDSLKHFEDTDPVSGQPIPAPWPTSNPSIYMNPLWYTHRTSYNEDRDRITLLGSAKYQLTDWLSIQARYTLDRYTDKTTGSFYDHTVQPTTQTGGQFFRNHAERSEQNIDLLLSGDNTLSPSFDLNYNIGASILDQKYNATNATANGLNIPNLFTLQNASNPANTYSISRSVMQSVYGTAQLGFKQYLYLDLSARNDWVSTLPPPYSYFYPSAGITAILSDMMHLPSWISFAKVRASYTFVGNGAGAYRLDQYYSFSPGGTHGYISRDVTQNIPNLKPAQTRSFEAGTEWRFLDNRIGIDATFYKTNTINQLLTLGLPVPTGFTTGYINAGNVQNTGVEIVLNASPVAGKTFNWNTTVNFARNENKVIRLLAPEIIQATLSGSARLGQVVVKEGGAYGDLYGQVWAKDDDGRYLVDNNGLPVITPNEKVGNFNPDFNLGWSNTFQYKNFTLSFLIDGQVGGSLISGTDSYLAFFGLRDYTEKYRDGGLVLNAVHADGSQNTTAIDAEQFWGTVSQGGRAAWTQFFTYDATNFRLREISLGYTFNLNKGFLKMARVSLTGGNLFFLYRGESVLDIPGIGKRKIPVDPGVSLGAGNSQGIESGMPPISRNFGLNVKLSF